MPHGRAIGSTDSRGGEIRESKVRSSDLAATVFHHLDIPADAHWLNPQGRPIPIIPRTVGRFRTGLNARPWNCP
jgi:hypothetical protein